MGPPDSSGTALGRWNALIRKDRRVPVGPLIYTYVTYDRSRLYTGVLRTRELRATHPSPQSPYPK